MLRKQLPILLVITAACGGPASTNEVGTDSNISTNDSALVAGNMTICVLDHGFNASFPNNVIRIDNVPITYNQGSSAKAVEVPPGSTVTGLISGQLAFVDNGGTYSNNTNSGGNYIFVARGGRAELNSASVFNSFNKVWVRAGGTFNCRSASGKINYEEGAILIGCFSPKWIVRQRDWVSNWAQCSLSTPVNYACSGQNVPSSCGFTAY